MLNTHDDITSGPQAVVNHSDHDCVLRRFSISRPVDISAGVTRDRRHPDLFEFSETARCRNWRLVF